MITLGDGAFAFGSGESAKLSRLGTTGTGRGDWLGVLMVVTGDMVRVLVADGVLAGEATLGGALLDTLGGVGDGMRALMLGGGIRRPHDSKRSRRLVMASSWVMVVGSGVSLRAPAMAWRPWMILSSGDGAGMVRNACQNSTLSEMTWLLVSLLTRQKHR